MNIRYLKRRIFNAVKKKGCVRKPSSWMCLVGLGLVVLFTVFIGSWKNYVDSDYQLFHWHVPLTTTISTHTLCILVPYRDREAELRIFIPHIDDFLNKQNVLHKIIVLNQTDNLRFNRASLINVGWYEADRVGCDYLVMHDVDLLPLNPKLDYSYPGKGIIRHISSPEYHPKRK